MEKNIICIAYETVQTVDGALPLLAPMSEITVKIFAQIAAYYLALLYSGTGVLMGGGFGVKPSKVFVIGRGTVGTCTLKVVAGIGASVILLDVNINRLRYLDNVLPKNITLPFSNHYSLEEKIKDADAVIGAVLFQALKRLN